MYEYYRKQPKLQSGKIEQLFPFSAFFPKN